MMMENEVIFEIGDVRLRAEILDDGRCGVKLDTAKSLVHGITPEAVIHMRDSLTNFLVMQGHE